jgi:nicotinamidase-related amidase
LDIAETQRTTRRDDSISNTFSEEVGMLEFQGIHIPRSLEDLVSPRTAALIVYDMQAGIVRQIKDGMEITKRVGLLLQAARRTGMRTFFTRHLSLPRNLMGAFQLRTAMAWQRIDSPVKIEPMFLRDSPAFQIVPELQPLPTEAIFDKITMSAFEGTPLGIALRDCEIKSFIIAGIALEIGIDPTCRQGADLGLIPVLVRDACGFGDAEAAKSSLATLTHMGDTVISDTSTICELMQKSTIE